MENHQAFEFLKGHVHVPELAVVETRFSKTSVSHHINAYGAKGWGEKMKSGNE